MACSESAFWKAYELGRMETYRELGFIKQKHLDHWYRSKAADNGLSTEGKSAQRLAHEYFEYVRNMF